MIINDLWWEYLSVTNRISKFEDTSPIYSWNLMRVEFHSKLIEYYEEHINNFKRERFADICHDLDIICGFSTPINRNDSINYYVKKMVRYMLHRGKKYCNGTLDYYETD